MQARMFRIGPALISLLLLVACTNVRVVRFTPDASSGDDRTAITQCCRSAGLRPHEEIDLEMSAAHGSYGQRIRNDPELLEIFGAEYSEVGLYAREGGYELEVKSSVSSEDLAAEIERCLHEVDPDAE